MSDHDCPGPFWGNYWPAFLECCKGNACMWQRPRAPLEDEWASYRVCMGCGQALGTGPN